MVHLKICGLYVNFVWIDREENSVERRGKSLLQIHESRCMKVGVGDGLVKHLLLKPEDLGLGPQCPCKKPAEWHKSITPTLRR